MSPQKIILDGVEKEVPDDDDHAQPLYTPVNAAAPEGPTLRDWRVALELWGRLSDVESKVANLVASSDPAAAKLGNIATQSIQYANNVFRRELLPLAPVLGFTTSDVDESFWRARQVALGDLSGKWPLS